MSNITKIYSQICAIKESLPQEKHVGRKYVDSYNFLIDGLATEIKSPLDEFKVSESVLEHTSGVTRPGVGFQGFGEKRCERGLLLMKLDAILLLFRLKEEQKTIGFQL